MICDNTCWPWPLMTCMMYHVDLDLTYTHPYVDLDLCWHMAYHGELEPLWHIASHFDLDLWCHITIHIDPNWPLWTSSISRGCSQWNTFSDCACLFSFGKLDANWSSASLCMPCLQYGVYCLSKILNESLTVCLFWTGAELWKCIKIWYHPTPGHCIFIWLSVWHAPIINQSHII